MSLSTSDNRVVATGDGVTLTFYFNRLLYDESHLEVYLDDALQSVGYTVNGVPGSSTSVTFIDPPAASVQVLLLRVVPLTQLSVYAVGGAFPAATTEKNFDLAVMALQQFDEINDRSLRLPVEETGTEAKTVLPDVTTRSSKYLAWNASGEPIAVDPATASGTSVLATGSTTARLLADRFADWKNVKDFGAIGDGTGNDGPAIRAAINAGKFVWFPAGTYRITDDSLASLTAASHGGTTLMGAGIEATILTFANGANDCIKADGTNSGAGQFNGLRISSMSLKESSKTGGRMIAVSYAYKVLLDNLYIECWTGIEAYVTNNFDIMHVNIQSVTGGGSAPSGYYGPAGQAPLNCYALFWHAPSDGTYRSDALRAINFTANAQYSGADGILWDGAASTFDAFQCTMLECDYGMRVRNTGASGTYFPQFGEFHNFNVDGAKTQGVRIEAGAGFRFIGCNLSNTSGGVGQGNADTNTLYIAHDEPNSYTRNLVFEGCTISNCRQDTANVAARNVRFHGCAIYDGSKQTANTYNGITIAAEAEDVLISANGVGLYGANNQYKYAIEIKDTTVRIVVANNQLYGYQTKAILWGNNDASSICQANSGDGTLISQDIIPFVNPQSQTVTGNFTATAAKFVNGVLVLGGTPGAHNMTTPTAAQIVAAIMSPSPGKGIQLHLINATNNTTTWVAGSGVTFAGVTPFTLATGIAKIYTIRISDVRAGSEAVIIYG